MSELLRLAEETAKKAGASVAGASDARVVQDLARDVKIEADARLHALISRELSQGSPYPVLSEEAEASEAAWTSGMRWIIDPLDGSVNFSRSLPLCCVSIALWKDDSPLLGVVHDFHRSETFTGIADEGARLNGRPLDRPKPVQAKDAILLTGFPSAGDFTDAALLPFVRSVQSFKKVRLLGSAALSLAYVAAGRADAYREEKIGFWDVAAGLALAKAAGVAAIWESSGVNRLNVKAGIL